MQCIQMLYGERIKLLNIANVAGLQSSKAETCLNVALRHVQTVCCVRIIEILSLCWDLCRAVGRKRDRPERVRCIARGNPLDMLETTWQINMLEVAWNDDFTHMDVL